MLGFMGESYGQYESLAAIEDNDCSTDSVNKEGLQTLVDEAAASMYVYHLLNVHCKY
jgi:hypothetical protein